MKLVCKCIPECFLKFWLTIGGVSHIVIGIIFIILAILIKTLDIVPPELESGFNKAFIATLLTGLFILLSGILGIVGGCKQIKILICCFLIFTTIFFIIIFVVTILVYGGKTILKDEIGTKDACFKNLSGAQDGYTEISNYFCHKDYCVCKMSASDALKWKSKKSNRLYQQLENGGYDPNSNVDDVMQCKEQINRGIQRHGGAKPDWSVVNSHSGFYFAIEELFDCSGVCAPLDMYYFSYVNRGPPKNWPKNQGCWVQLYNKLDDFLRDITIPMWIITSMFLLNVIFSCCLLCHRKRNNYMGDKYDNFDTESSNSFNNDVENKNYTKQQFLD